MKVKVDVRAVNRLIDPRFPIEKLYKQLKGEEGNIGLIFGEPSAGAGQLLWTLDGEGWISFKDLDDEKKPLASLIFKEKQEKLKTSLGNSKLSDTILILPEDKYLFFRNMDSEPEVGLTCWGYCYPHFKGGMELETWVKRIKVQEVAISFSWDGNLLKDYPFKFNKYTRQTATNGRFLVDQPLPVGSSYSVSTLKGETFTLLVVEGQKDYNFDLTEYFSVDITVKKDGKALAESEIELNFNGVNQHLKTDSSGCVSLRLPFVGAKDGTVREPQTECVVTCEGETESQTPSVEKHQLHYLFQLMTPVKEEPKKEDKKEDKKEEKKEEKPPLKPDVKEVKEKELPPPAPQFIGLTLLDYAGYPVEEMEVTLFFPKKRVHKFVTDKKGRIEFPKEWMPDKKGKIKVKFTATAEYQKSHDLHRDEARKKK